MKSQTRNIYETVKLFQEVLKGNRGFVSITEESKKSGIEKDLLTKQAENMGLIVEKHGRNGMCAFKK